MGLLSNSVAAHPYQNQTWVPHRAGIMQIPQGSDFYLSLIYAYQFDKNIIL